MWDTAAVGALLLFAVHRFFFSPKNEETMERKRSPLPVILRVPFALAGPLRDSCFKFFCLHNGPNFLLLFRFRKGPLLPHLLNFGRVLFSTS